jgi:hypothetical protein
MLGVNFYQVVSFKHKLIFLTPPKCSTYSLKVFLDKCRIQMDEPTRPLSTPFYHPTLSEIIYCYNIGLDELKDYKIIQIIRNPYDRFLSSYIHQTQLLNIDKNNVTDTNIFNQFLSQLESYKYLLPENVNEFYLNFYQNEEYKWYHFNLNQHGGIRFYYNQSWWNNIDPNININYFKLEDINKNINPLKNLLNIDNTHLYSIENSKSYNIPNIKNLIFEYKDKIYNLFKEDFKQFNYERI